MVPVTGRANDGVGEVGLGVVDGAARLLHLAAKRIDLLLARPQFHQLVGFLQRVDAMQRVVVPRLGIVYDLLGHHSVLEQALVAIQRDPRVVQVALRGVDIGQGLRDLFRTRPVNRLVQLGLETGQLALGLRELGLILVVFQPDEHGPLPDEIALIHANPLDLADHLGGHLDAVRGHNVAGRVEDHARGRAARADGAHALHLHHGRRIQLLRREAPAAQQKQNQHAANNPARGPFRGLLRAPLLPIDLQILQFRIHKYLVRPPAAP